MVTDSRKSSRTGLTEDLVAGARPCPLGASGGIHFEILVLREENLLSLGVAIPWLGRGRYLE